MSVSPELIDEFVALLADALAPNLAEELTRAMPALQVAEPWRLVGVGEVAAMLGRSRRWVHGAVKERGLPYIRLDGGARSRSTITMSRRGHGAAGPGRRERSACGPLAGAPATARPMRVRVIRL